MANASRWLLLMLAASPGIVQAAEKAPRAIRPIDECSADRSFAAFLGRFDAAVAARDTRALLQLVSPQVQLGFGGDDGIKAFQRDWKIALGAKSPIWSELKAMRSLGCAPGAERTMVMPRLAERLPGGEEMIQTYAPVRDPVALRAGPSATAAVRQQLHWDVLYPDGEAEGEAAWLKLRTASGSRGYVRASDIRSASGVRMGFGRVKGQWMMTYFLAGD